jgi:DHA1 family tetracycline resistance protein-like MFS transporter
MNEQVRAAAVEVSQTARPARSAAVAFIFITILLDMLALGLIMPILPKLVESFVNNDTARAARSAEGRLCCCRISGLGSTMS